MRAGAQKFDVQYVGMASAGNRRGLRGRLSSHAKSKKKADLWSHFSVYEVWDNIRDDEIRELEGLFRHIYREDARASALNVQRGFKKVRLVRQNNLQDWSTSDASHGRPSKRGRKRPKGTKRRARRGR
jgi:hypothetical protein